MSLIRSYPQSIDLDELEERARGALFFRTSNGFEFLGDKEGYDRWIRAGAGSARLHREAAETILALIGMLRGQATAHKGK